MKSIAGRRVRMFRCHVPPLIGGKTQQAHMVEDLHWTAEVNKEATGIIVTTQYGSEHFCAFTNIQNTEFFPEELPSAPMQLKPKLGRPFKEG